jgi:polyisoprenoid-binding protein YceI
MKNVIASIAFVTGFMLASQANAEDTYATDPMHTSVYFSVRHLGISNVPGKFKEITGSIVLDGDALKKVTATIQVQSVDTGVTQRDNDLRTANFFDAVKYPTITFRTKRVEKDEKQFVVVGDFTMRGVTKELRLPVTLNGPIKDPWGNMRIGLEAKVKLNRKDYGINYNEVLKSGVPDVGDEVEINLNAEATKVVVNEKTPTQ